MIVLDTNISAGGATSQYKNFNANSFVKFGQFFFIASDVGLYKLSGTTKIFSAEDASSETIESFFEPITFDFGIANQKRLRAVYIGYEADGDLTLKVSTELSVQESYTIPASTNNRHARKVNINRSLKGRYWTFQIYGNGVNFAIDTIQVLPIVRSHGFDTN